MVLSFKFFQLLNILQSFLVIGINFSAAIVQPEWNIHARNLLNPMLLGKHAGKERFPFAELAERLFGIFPGCAEG